MGLHLILQETYFPYSGNTRKTYTLLESTQYTNLLTIITLSSTDEIIDTFDCDGRSLDKTFAKNIIKNLPLNVVFPKEKLTEVIRISKIDKALK